MVDYSTFFALAQENAWHFVMSMPGILVGYAIAHPWYWMVIGLVIVGMGIKGLRRFGVYSVRGFVRYELQD